MKLTGKAKEVFEKWYELKYEAIRLRSIDDEFYLEGFYELPKSMQRGVYQDWANTLGYYLNVDYGCKSKTYYFDIWDGTNYEYNNKSYLTREEAQDALVDKLNELINNN